MISSKMSKERQNEVKRNQFLLDEKKSAVIAGWDEGGYSQPTNVKLIALKRTAISWRR